MFTIKKRTKNMRNISPLMMNDERNVETELPEEGLLEAMDCPLSVLCFDSGSTLSGTGRACGRHCGLIFDALIGDAREMSSKPNKVQVKNLMT